MEKKKQKLAIEKKKLDLENEKTNRQKEYHGYIEDKLKLEDSYKMELQELEDKVEIEQMKTQRFKKEEKIRRLEYKREKRQLKHTAKTQKFTNEETKQNTKRTLFKRRVENEETKWNTSSQATVFKTDSNTVACDDEWNNEKQEIERRIKYEEKCKKEYEETKRKNNNQGKQLKKSQLQNEKERRILKNEKQKSKIEYQQEKQQLDEDEKKLELKQNDKKAITVSEAEFDRIIDRFYDFRQKLFFVFVKILLCICFFVVATKVLLHNNSIDLFGADYIIKLIFIAFSPKILFSMVEYKEEKVEDTVEKNREEIRKTFDSSQTEQQQFEAQCCECNGWSRNCSGEKCSICCSCTSCIQHCCNIGCCPTVCEDNCSCFTCPLLSTFCCCKCTCNINSEESPNPDCCCFTCIT